MKAWHPDQKIDRDSVSQLMNFSPLNSADGRRTPDSSYELQLSGSLGLHNMLCEKRYAYLADEVGMGKTMVALGVVSLLLARKPDARIMVVVPKHGIANQWIRDWNELVKSIWRKSVVGVRDPLLLKPEREAVQYLRSDEIITAFEGSGKILPILSIYAFRFLRQAVMAGSDDGYPVDAWFADLLDGSISEKRFSSEFIPKANRRIDRKGKAGLDLLVVDESQCLRNENLTNETFSGLLGLNYRPRVDHSLHCHVDRMLFMSATPMHRREEDLYNQLAYIDPRGSEAIQKAHELDERTKSKYMIRRFRRFEGLTAMEYRDEHPREIVPRDIQGHLFLAMSQKLLETELQEGRAGNARFEMGFMEMFESYGREYEDDLEEQLPEEIIEQNQRSEKLEMTRDPNERTSPKDEEEKRKRSEPPDKKVLKALHDTWVDTIGEKEYPHHPKYDEMRSLVLEELRRLDIPEKRLVFVRRVKGTKEVAGAFQTAHNQFLWEQWDMIRFHLDIHKDELSEILRARKGCGDDAPCVECSQCSPISAFMERKNDKLKNRLIYWRESRLDKFFSSEVNWFIERLAPGKSVNMLSQKWIKDMSKNGESLLLFFAFAAGNPKNDPVKEMFNGLAQFGMIEPRFKLFKRVEWRTKQFMDPEVFRLIRRQVLKREDVGKSDDRLIQENEQQVGLTSNTYAVAISGENSKEGVLKVQRRFNSPAFPDIIVCTDILKEGLDFHVFCRKVVHYGLAWSAGDLEQRIGRCDRFFSRICRMLESDERPEKGIPKLEVDYPVLLGSIDEKQVARILIEKIMISDLTNTIRRPSSVDPENQWYSLARARQMLQEPKEKKDPFKVDPLLLKGRLKLKEYAAESQYISLRSEMLKMLIAALGDTGSDSKQSLRFEERSSSHEDLGIIFGKDFSIDLNFRSLLRSGKYYLFMVAQVEIKKAMVISGNAKGDLDKYHYFCESFPGSVICSDSEENYFISSVMLVERYFKEDLLKSSSTLGICIELAELKAFLLGLTKMHYQMTTSNVIDCKGIAGAEIADKKLIRRIDKVATGRKERLNGFQRKLLGADKGWLGLSITAGQNGITLNEILYFNDNDLGAKFQNHNGKLRIWVTYPLFEKGAVLDDQELESMFTRLVAARDRFEFGTLTVEETDED